jgi:hypothetical protein
MMEKSMKKLAILGAMAALAMAVTGPAMAKHVKGHHRHAIQPQQQQDTNAGWNDNGWTNNGWNDTAWNNDWNNNRWDRRSSGFGPGDVAAGAVGTAAGIAGAAIGTAGAIATAPFGGPADAYAYDARPYSYGNRYGAGPVTYDRGPTGYYGDWDSYAARNGIACRPGTLFKGADGFMHPCQ